MSRMRCHQDSTIALGHDLPLACPIAWSDHQCRTWQTSTNLPSPARTTYASSCILFLTAAGHPRHVRDQASFDDDRLGRHGHRRRGGCTSPLASGCLPAAPATPVAAPPVLSSTPARKEMEEGERS